MVAAIPRDGFANPGGFARCCPYRQSPMEKDAKEALQVTKEIVVKFIETGRVSPANVAEVFPLVYAVVLETIAPDSPVSPRSSGQEARHKTGAA